MFEVKPKAQKRFVHPFHGARPKIMERRPDPAPATHFALDDAKLRQEIDLDRDWRGTPLVKILGFVGDLALWLILAALLFGLVVVLVAFPEFGIGIGLFVGAVIVNFFSRRSTQPPASSR